MSPRPWSSVDKASSADHVFQAAGEKGNDGDIPSRKSALELSRARLPHPELAQPVPHRASLRWQLLPATEPPPHSG